MQTRKDFNYILKLIIKLRESYLILLGEGTGACSAITGNTDVNLSVGLRRRAVLDDNFQMSLCLCGVCSCALYLLSIAPTAS